MYVGTLEYVTGPADMQGIPAPPGFPELEPYLLDENKLVLKQLALGTALL